ncbi:hypothetical protein HDU87_002484, partial [Geranomyces variabilis]
QAMLAEKRASPPTPDTDAINSTTLSASQTEPAGQQSVRSTPRILHSAASAESLDISRMQRHSTGAVSIARAGSGNLTVDINGSASPTDSVGEITSVGGASQASGSNVNGADSAPHSESIGDLSGM